jgi:hypothetical protein
MFFHGNIYLTIQKFKFNTSITVTYLMKKYTFNILYKKASFSVISKFVESISENTSKITLPWIMLYLFQRYFRVH